MKINEKNRLKELRMKEKADGRRDKNPLHDGG